MRTGSSRRCGQRWRKRWQSLGEPLRLCIGNLAKPTWHDELELFHSRSLLLTLIATPTTIETRPRAAILIPHHKAACLGTYEHLLPARCTPEHNPWVACLEAGPSSPAANPFPLHLHRPWSLIPTKYITDTGQALLLFKTTLRPGERPYFRE